MASERARSKLGTFKVKDKKIKWGIIGTGRMSGWFCDDFKNVPNGELAAVCSRSEDAAKRFASKYNIQNIYTDLDALINSGEIDVAYIATPHTSHKAFTKKCLSSGMAVVCEKPFVTSVKDAIEIIETANTNQTYFMEAMWTWHLPAIKAAKAWVESGRIGDILHFKADFGYPVPFSSDAREFDPSDSGGVLREMGIYPVALMDLFIGLPLKDLRVIHSLAPTGVEDDLTAMFDFGDLTAVITSSFKCRLGNSAQIIGTKGHIIIPDFFRAHRAELYSIDELLETADFQRGSTGYAYQAVSVGEDLLAGETTSKVVPPEKSLKTQMTMKAILDAMGLPEIGDNN